MIKVLVLFGVLASSAVEGVEPSFRVRRRTHHVERRLNDDDFFLTHSDDGKSKTLDIFALDLFTTPSVISDSAYPVLRMAMNKFLLAEFNAIYLTSDNGLESVGSEITALETTSSPARRALQKTGTEATMEVTLTFENEPSPPSYELETTIRDVMLDLSLFVTNLTSFAHEDWKGVTEAYRRDITPSPTTAPGSGGTTGIQNSDTTVSTASTERNRNGVVGTVVPTVMVAATLIALVVFLFVQRRARTRAETPKNGDVMFVGVDNDLYSMDHSLESSRSPGGYNLSPANESAAAYSTSVDGYSTADGSVPGDSVFSGVEVSPTSASHIRGTKSLMSGYTNASSATIHASNMKNHQKKKFTSAGSSLFAFKENGEEEENDEAMQPPRLTDSDVSDDEPVHKDPVQGDSRSMFSCGYGSQAPAEPAENVLVDLQKLASAREVHPRDPTPLASQQARGGPALTYNPFNCNPVLTREEEYVVKKTTSPGGLGETNNMSHVMDVTEDNESPVQSSSIMACRPFNLGGNTKTPLVKNRSMATPGSASSGASVGAMSGQATKIIGDIYSTTPSPTSRSRSFSADASRPQMSESGKKGSRSAPNTPDRNMKSSRWNRLSPLDADPTIRSARNSDKPQISNYGCYPFAQVVDHAPEPPGEDPPVGGRRHAGNTGVDGSAMYQTNAMHPLDWSYKSVDTHSIGESTISDHDGVGMPRQFLFGGRKNGTNDTSLANAMKQNASPLSATNDSSQASASRQLINDLVWLEKKIADVKQGSGNKDPPAIDAVDSLSYVSTDNEAFASMSSGEGSLGDPSIATGKNASVMSSIVCRDCYAPPGKLHIVIHSTKDGPAVHTVKQGSSLEGHIFPGDLIISVDNVDTRSFTAEQVMKMMASKSGQERKITVLHFDEED